ncbi:MAG: septum site-determining protein MinC [Leptolyngbyaceae cyanobacterium SM1_1_3]|nr:septum site-determining protein MinC [Leptolyngbyaceae cyanobacterium SM1_1_3]NJN02502.1 septum site-determining protein MinC [Leptolyngbyaceae cyanobacterium RM1_1_2]NJO11053.1 septum site-determining protein MinC [Leptolyngbyaceae cyanobacterium SL_1_1]
MTSDSLPTPITQLSPNSGEVSPGSQVRFKSEGGRLLLLLPPAADTHSADSPADGPADWPLNWPELWLQIKQRLNGGDRFWQPQTAVHLVARDRLLDVRQLQAIEAALAEQQLTLRRVYTSRRQTAVAAATAGYSIEQQTSLAHLTPVATEAEQALEEPLYLQNTVRSGTEVRHPGTIVVLGDTNPGSRLVAAGDIFVWGRLRGVAHAGSAGNPHCRIMALHLEPTQLRIADKVALPPANPPVRYQPEVAYIGASGIHIATAADFARTYLSHPSR